MCASVLQGANSRELLRPWAGLEAYVQRSEARPRLRERRRYLGSGTDLIRGSPARTARGISDNER